MQIQIDVESVKMRLNLVFVEMIIRSTRSTAIMVKRDSYRGLLLMALRAK